MAEAAAEETVDKITLYKIQLRAVLDADTKVYTDLHKAVNKRRYRKIQALLKEGANVEAHNSYGLTPLHLSASLSDIQSSKLLLNHGAQPKPECCAKFPPLMFAVAAKCKPLIEIFLKHGCNINELVDQSFGYLHYWVRHNDMGMVKFLLDNGADIDNLDYDNATPLCIAVRYRNMEMIEFLVEKGASVTDKAKMGHSALFEALYLKDDDIFSLLISYANDFDDTTKNGENILITATKERQYTIMRQLLEMGANPDVTCLLFMSPLHYAVRKNDCTAIALLLEFQANAYSVRTPMHLSPKIIELLRADNVRVHVDTSWDNFSPLDFAYLYDHDCIELLLSSILGWENRLINDGYLKPYFSMNRNCLKYYLKRKIAGMGTYAKLNDSAERVMRNTNFENSCREELEKLKSENVLPNVSFYDFMLSPKSKLIVYTKHQDLIKTFNGTRYIREFPLYKHILKYTFIIGRRYIKMWEKSLDVLTTLFDNQLPALVIENILDLLNDRDIKTIESALKR